MLITIIILCAVVVIEFLLIAFLYVSNYNQGKTIHEMVDFFEQYVKKTAESREKMVETIDLLADKVAEHIRGES